MLSQDDEEVGLYFVIPSECGSEKDCETLMLNTFDDAVEHGLTPQWLTDAKCCSLQPDKRNVFVFQAFSGKAFEHLRKFKCVLVGPLCLMTIFNEKIQLPHLPFPFFTMAMFGLTITASGCGPQRKAEIREKIELMGGLYRPQLTASSTHLIVHSVQSEKYAKAVAASMPVMTEEWLDAVYSASLKGLVKGNDPQFDRYKCPCFKGLTISLSKMKPAHKKKVQELIESNGGKHVGTFTSGVALLVAGQPSGDKFKYAQLWKVQCVTPQYVYDSVAAGVALPVHKYEIQARGASTPEKEEQFQHFPDMSMMSNIAPEERTHVDDTMTLSSTMGSMADASVMSTMSSFKAPLHRGGPSKAPVFVRPQAPITKTSESPKRPAQAPRSVTPNKKTSPAQFKHLLDDLDLQKTKEAGPFLDGCKVYLYGFNSEHEEKLRKVLKGSGASRFLELSDSITHVLLGADCDPAFSKQLKQLSYRPHVVSVQWLLQSIALRRPASEEQFSCAETGTKNTPPETPSPLSKKGLALLQRGDESPVAGGESHARPADSSKLSSKKSSRLLKELREPDNEEADLTALYRKESSADKPPQVLPSFNSRSQSASADETANESAVCSQSDHPVFTGLTFSVVGLPEPEEVSKLIEQYGGRILPRSYRGVPDYAVVPVTGATVTAAGDVVTAFWVEECIFLNQVLPLEYFYQPISMHKGKYPLRGCVVALSGYGRKERIFLMEVTNILGGLAQEVFARKDNPEKNAKASTHLVCQTAEGSKFAAAKKWKLPAVTHLWILECCKTGTRCPVEPFLVEPGQEIVDNVPVFQEVSGSERTMNDVTRRPEAEQDSSSATPEVAARRLEDVPKENLPVGDDPKTPARPLALQRLRGQAERESPFHLRTPDTPYGISENPSPGERKRLKEWVESIPDYPQSPAYPNRRLSTPMSELRRQVWAKYAIPTPKTPLEQKAGDKRLSDQTEESPQSAKRPRVEGEGGVKPGDAATPSGPEKNSLQRNLFAENVSRAEGQIEEVNKLLQMPIATPGVSSGGSRNSANFPSPPKEKPAVPLAPKEVSQPYCLNWEDPATVAEAKEAPREERRPSTSKRKSCEDDGTPSKRTSLDAANAESARVEPKEERPSKTWIFMLSNIDGRERFVKMVDALGGKVIQGTHFQPQMTHLVIDKPVRSEKLLASIASGKWILHASYIEDSYRAGKFLEEEKYEWGSPSNEALRRILKPGSTEFQLAEAVHRWRTELDGKRGAFSHFRAVLAASSAKIASFQRLIEAGGGVVLDPSDRETATHYIIDQKTSPEGLKVPKGVPILPLMYLNDFLVQYPPPDIRKIAIHQ